MAEFSPETAKAALRHKRHAMKSLALSECWDLTLDTSGNLAVVADDRRIEQDVAAYERVFQGEEWYDTAAGVPYLDRELAAMPASELVRERARLRALEVPGVVDAAITLTSFGRRVLTGRIALTTENGSTLDVSI